MPTALMPLVEGFEETEAVAVIDVLRRAGVEVTTAGVAAKRVVGSHAIAIEADALYADVASATFDVIVLPGGPGTKKLNDVPGLHDRLRQQIEEDRLVAAICAAPTVLAAAGILGGRRASCFPGVESAMSGAMVLHQPVVEDGNVITSRAMGTAIEFGLAVASRLVGRAKSDEVAQSILHV